MWHKFFEYHLSAQGWSSPVSTPADSALLRFWMRLKRWRLEHNDDQEVPFSRYRRLQFARATGGEDNPDLIAWKQSAFPPPKLGTQWIATYDGPDSS